MQVTTPNATPLISVLMTSFNREKYIEEAIASVLNSLYTNFELIIVDDCSTDRTVEIIKSFMQSDRRLKFFQNKKNLGQFANRNKAATVASGKYIKYLDSDDIMAQNCLLEISRAIERYPEAGMGSECSSDFDLNKGLLQPRENFINHYFNSSPFLYIGPSGTFFKKEIFDKCGGFEENSGILSDTLLNMKIAAIAPSIPLIPRLFYWREHAERVTTGQSDIFAMIVERHYLNNKILEFENCPLTPLERKIVKRNLKNIYIRNSFRIIRNVGFKRYLQLQKIKEIKILDFLFAGLPNQRINNWK